MQRVTRRKLVQRQLCALFSDATMGDCQSHAAAAPTVAATVSRRCCCCCGISRRRCCRSWRPGCVLPAAEEVSCGAMTERRATRVAMASRKRSKRRSRVAILGAIGSDNQANLSGRRCPFTSTPRQPRTTHRVRELRAAVVGWMLAQCSTGARGRGAKLSQFDFLHERSGATEAALSVANRRRSVLLAERRRAVAARARRRHAMARAFSRAAPANAYSNSSSRRPIRRWSSARRDASAFCASAPRVAGPAGRV